MRRKVARGVAIAFAACVAVTWLYMADKTGWYAELKSWQTGIGALVGALGGLLALMGAALYNAKLNRDRDDRLRERDARGLAKLLASDMFTIAEIGTSYLDAFDRGGAEDLYTVATGLEPLPRLTPLVTHLPRAEILPFELIDSADWVFITAANVRSSFEKSFAGAADIGDAQGLRRILDEIVRRARRSGDALRIYAQTGRIEISPVKPAGETKDRP
jgi:hypothetical protein